MASKRVLITGGTKGIGLGLAESFLAQGHQVFVCARQQPESLPEAQGRRALFAPCNVRRAEACQQLIAEAHAAMGGLDLLINNAGGSPEVPAAECSPGFAEAIIQLNLLGAFYCSQAAFEVMKKNPEGGCIIQIASVSGQRPSPGTALYGAAKAGLIHLTGSLAQEWAPLVRVCYLALGLVDTPMAREHYGSERAMSKVAATIPAGRFAQVEDAMAACAYLSSEAASYLTGSGLTLDGGGDRPAFLSARLP